MAHFDTDTPDGRFNILNSFLGYGNLYTSKVWFIGLEEGENLNEETFGAHCSDQDFTLEEKQTQYFSDRANKLFLDRPNGPIRRYFNGTILNQCKLAYAVINQIPNINDIDANALSVFYNRDFYNLCSQMNYYPVPFLNNADFNENVYQDLFGVNPIERNYYEGNNIQRESVRNYLFQSILHARLRVNNLPYIFATGRDDNFVRIMKDEVLEQFVPFIAKPFVEHGNNCLHEYSNNGRLWITHHLQPGNAYANGAMNDILGFINTYSN